MYTMKTYAVILALLLAPIGASAQIAITEVMYDLEGGDSGREWVEIHNTGSASVNLADWRFFEQDTNHRFQDEGDTTLGSDERAIIADDVSAFENDNPNVSVLILDSSFSLRNTGEYVALKNAEEEIVDEITYTPQADADGGGASLQLINGSWNAYAPTPGAENATEKISGENDDDNNDNNQNNTKESDGDSTEGDSSDANTNTDTEAVNSTRPVPPKIYAYGGDDRTLIVGADVSFTGEALGIEHKPLTGAQFIWNFGDGATAEGKTVTHHFAYPGTYIVVLTAVSGKLSTSDHIRITAEPSDISISGVSSTPDAYIAISNDANRDVYIGGWFLQTHNDTFQFPPETYIASDGTLTLPKHTTGLSPQESSTVRLLYPNTNVAFVYPADVNEQSDSQQEKTKQAPTQPIAHEPKAEEQPNVRIAQASTKSELSHASSAQTATDTAQTHQTEPSSTNTAMVIGGDEKGATDWDWVLGLIALVLLSAGSIGFIRYKEATASTAEQTAREADEYEIIEEDKY